MILSKWDKRFLDLAEHVSSWSKDTTKVGAVIVNEDRKVLSLGYNGFPIHVHDHTERYSNRETKYKFVCHAERNALDNVDISVRKCILYATLQPCNECTKSIIQKGIKRVVSYVDKSRPDYSEFKKWSVPMMNEAMVEIIEIERS